MEHRNSSRIPWKEKIELINKGNSCGSFTSGNLSYGGLFIDRLNGLSLGKMLTVRILSNLSSQHYDLKAMVVHQEPDGAGFMWVDYNVPFFNELDQMLSVSK